MEGGLRLRASQLPTERITPRSIGAPLWGVANRNSDAPFRTTGLASCPAEAAAVDARTAVAERSARHPGLARLRGAIAVKLVIVVPTGYLVIM